MRRVVFKFRFLGLVLLAMLAGAWPVAAQAAAPVSPAGFAVLSAAPGGGGAVTCTRSTINGNVGSSGLLAAVVQTGCTITGAITTSVSTTGFDNAYSALAGVPCDHTLTLDQTQSLAPGVYCSAAGATATNRVLTLNGPRNGIWLFKIGTSGTGALTGTNLKVVMAGAGQPCNVNWWTAQAASLTVNTVASTPFQGTILAGAAITLVGTAATAGPPTALTVTGRLWARGAVSMTDSAVVPSCTSPITVPKTKCKPGTSNDEDENAEQSKSTEDSHKSGDSAIASASQSSKDDGKSENGKHDSDEGNKNGCDSDNSNHGDNQSKDS
jgi:hypothetical protein